MAARKLGLAHTACISKEGLEALKASDRNKIDTTNLTILESIDVDACFEEDEPNAARWDYYIRMHRRGELYLEVHEVSEEELNRLLAKANWLRDKIKDLGWPSTEGRPLLVAPTKGITPYAAYGVLSKTLALHKILIVMKGDRLDEILE